MKKADSFIPRSFRVGGYSFLAALIVLAVLVIVLIRRADKSLAQEAARKKAEQKGAAA